MKTTLALLGFLLALVQCHVPVQKKPGCHHCGNGHLLKQHGRPTDACIKNGGYCIRNSKKEDCDGLLFPKECRSAFYSCCVEAVLKRDECSTGLDTCPTNSECRDKTEGYECVCTAGFGQCGDINECNSNPCGPNTQCQNTWGSYECVCNAGFENVNGACVGTSECSQDPCGPNTACFDIPGSHICICNTGYSLSEGTCVDIDECLSDVCIPDSNCTNTLGSYQCECVPGFTLGQGVCEDIDECELGTDTCLKIEECYNTQGSYTCLQRCSGGATFLPVNGRCAKLISGGTTFTAAEGRSFCPQISMYGCAIDSPEEIIAYGAAFLQNVGDIAWVFSDAYFVNESCLTLTKTSSSYVIGYLACDANLPAVICDDTGPI